MFCFRINHIFYRKGLTYLEEWRTYEKIPRYEVSSEARVRNSKSGRILKSSINKKGYKQVSLHDNGSQYTRKLSRIVAETFHPGEHEGMDVTFRDGDRINCRANNVEWKTRKDILKRTYELGRKQTHAMKRVRCVETGEEFESITECSRVMNINKTNISRCVNKRSFKTTGGYHFEFVE